MTRELTTVKTFEHGTLLEAVPHPHYTGGGTAHAYYVPDKARRHTGMRKINQMDEDERKPFFDLKSGPKWGEIDELTSVADIVELVEETNLNQTDGDVSGVKSKFGRVRAMQYTHSSEEMTVPPGVVKFCDPDAHLENNAITREPLERGYCWAAVQDIGLENRTPRGVMYDDDAQTARVHDARIPVRVLRDGTEAIVAFLAAHDHESGLIGFALGLEAGEDKAIIDELTDGR